MLVALSPRGRRPPSAKPTSTRTPASPRSSRASRLPIAPEDLIALKVLAGRSKDLEDARALLQLPALTLDRAMLDETLGALEDALERSDLRPLLAALTPRAARTRSAPPPSSPARTRG